MKSFTDTLDDVEVVQKLLGEWSCTLVRAYEIEHGTRQPGGLPQQSRDDAARCVEFYRAEHQGSKGSVLLFLTLSPFL